TSAGALPSASTRRREASTAATQPTRASVSQPMARGWRLPCETCTAWPRAAAETAKATAETAESSASEVTREQHSLHDAASLPFLTQDYGRLNALGSRGAKSAIVCFYNRVSSASWAKIRSTLASPNLRRSSARRTSSSRLLSSSAIDLATSSRPWPDNLDSTARMRSSESSPGTAPPYTR